jgi:hypothetical protein
MERFWAPVSAAAAELQTSSEATKQPTSFCEVVRQHNWSFNPPTSNIVTTSLIETIGFEFYTKINGNQ